MNTTAHRTGFRFTIPHGNSSRRTDNRALLDQWMSNWDDLVDFEVYTVLLFSAEAALRISPSW